MPQRFEIFTDGGTLYLLHTPSRLSALVLATFAVFWSGFVDEAGFIERKVEEHLGIENQPIKGEVPPALIQAPGRGREAAQKGPGHPRQ